MYNGLTKRADEIIIGDHVMTMDRGSLTVQNIITGMENQIYKIITEDRNEIRITNTHIMKICTDANSNGVNQSADLMHVGDRLMTPKGVVKITEIAIEPYNDIVYAFLLGDDMNPHFINVNGFWCGDFYAENQRSARSKELTETEKALIREFDRMFK